MSSEQPLETKTITFTSNYLRHEFAAAEQIAATLNQLGSVDQIQAKILDRLRAPAIDDALNQLDRVARERLAQGIEALREANNALDQFKQQTSKYLVEYSNLQDKARTLGSNIFHTGIESASVVLPAVKGLLPDVPDREIKLIGDYVTGGFQTAQNGVYAALLEPIGKAEDIGGQIRNGLTTPRMILSGVSRELGALAGEAEDKIKDIARKNLNLPNVNVDLSDAIPDAKLFGVIALRKIVAAVGRGQLPDINIIELPDKIERTWNWAAPLKDADFGILKFKVERVPGPSKVGLSIVSKTIVNIPLPKDLAAGKKPSATATLDAYLGALDGSNQPTTRTQNQTFSVNLLGMLRVNVNQLRVAASYNVGDPPPPPTVKPYLAADPVTFLGPLAFLTAFQKNLSFGGFDLNLDDEFVHVASNTTIPPISFGAFSCRNLTLHSGLALPLGDRTLRYEFAFSSFAKPFELSVMGFAGRGFFSASFESNGNRELMGALEFGGALSFDIGVASGGLYVMAGGYLKINNSATELAGYLRAGGGLDVLGLIHVCIEFFLALAYRANGSQSQLFGYCEITVSIDMCFYSFDVHLRMEKTIAGSEGAAAERLFVAQNVTHQLRPAYFNRPSTRGRFDLSDRPPAHPEIFSPPARWNGDYWQYFDFSRG